MQVRAFERKIYPLNDVQTKGKEEINAAKHNYSKMFVHILYQWKGYLSIYLSIYLFIRHTPSYEYYVPGSPQHALKVRI